MKTIVRDAKEWHFGGSSFPEPLREVFIMVEEDCFTPTQPLLLTAFGIYKFENEGTNKPSRIWSIVEEDGSRNEWLIAGGHSVYAWRYKEQVINSWS
jgi:hypothetical protein